VDLEVSKALLDHDTKVAINQKPVGFIVKLDPEVEDEIE
jgi:hypothetical protein